MSTQTFSKLATDNLNIILASLRHLEGAINAEDDLSDLSGVIDPAVLKSIDIDDLCQSLNFAVDPEHYRSVALSTGHLTEADRDLLVEQANSDKHNMVLSRETGFFIKLYEETEAGDEGLNQSPEYSEYLSAIVKWAYENDYRMIEFDNAATSLEPFPVFDW